MPNFTAYGPDNLGANAYGPIADGSTVYGTSSSGAEPLVITGQPLTFTQIVQQVTYYFNEGTPDEVALLITPETIATVQACGTVVVENNNWPTQLVTPVDEQIDALLIDLNAAGSVGEILALFNASNAAAGDLYANEIDRVESAEGETSTDADVVDVLSDIDDINAIKPEDQC